MIGLALTGLILQLRRLVVVGQQAVHTGSGGPR